MQNMKLEVQISNNEVKDLQGRLKAMEEEISEMKSKNEEVPQDEEPNDQEDKEKAADASSDVMMCSKCKKETVARTSVSPSQKNPMTINNTFDQDSFGRGADLFRKSPRALSLEKMISSKERLKSSQSQ